MKRIIGIIGVVAIAMTMFFSTNTNNNNDTDLASLIAINVANAETTTWDGCRYTGIEGDECKLTFITITNCANNSNYATCATN